MDLHLSNSKTFQVLSYTLAIPPLKLTYGKLFTIVTINCICLSTEVIMQYTLRKDIFAYVGTPVLMVLDTVNIIGPLLAHAVQIFESLVKRKRDAIIWTHIDNINKSRADAKSGSLNAIFRKDFTLMSVVPLIIQLGVILATYRSQRNWSLGIISRICSSLVDRWCVLAFIYYMRYMSECFSQMAKEVEVFNGLTRINKSTSDAIVAVLHQMKASFNMVWHLHGLVKNRYEIFLVSYIFLNLCGLTSSTYFLGTRLITRRFDYTLESALCLIPLVYTNIHMSVVAANFGLKQGNLLNTLQCLSILSWRNPKVVSAIKSLEIQIKLANLTPTVGGHLNVQYSSLVLGVIYIVTTYIFIFLFLN